MQGSPFHFKRTQTWNGGQTCRFIGGRAVTIAAASSKHGTTREMHACYSPGMDLRRRASSAGIALYLLVALLFFVIAWSWGRTNILGGHGFFWDAPVYARAITTWRAGGDPYTFTALPFLYPPLLLRAATLASSFFPGHSGWYLYLSLTVLATLSLPELLATVLILINSRMSGYDNIVAILPALLLSVEAVRFAARTCGGAQAIVVALAFTLFVVTTDYNLSMCLLFVAVIVFTLFRARRPADDAVFADDAPEQVRA